MPKSPPQSRFCLLGWHPTGDLAGVTYWTTQRGKIVQIPKSPPLNPPSVLQSQMRNYFRLAATAWRALTPEQRQRWGLASERLYLRCTGYNIWVWYWRFRDRETIATIQHQSKLELLSTLPE